MDKKNTHSLRLVWKLYMDLRSNWKSPPFFTVVHGRPCRKFSSPLCLSVANHLLSWDQEHCYGAFTCYEDYIQVPRFIYDIFGLGL